MSITKFEIKSGADLLQTHYDDAWKYGSSSYNNQYYAAGGTHGYCSGNKHRAVFKIKVPSTANSPLKKGYLTFNFNGVVASSGSRTLNYVLTSVAPPSPGSADGTIPTEYYRKGSVTFSGLTAQSKQLTFTIGSESDLFTIPAANEYMYLWLYNDSGSSMECYNGTSYYSVDLYAQMVGAPSAPTIVKITEPSSSIESLTYIKPGQKVRIKWDNAAAGTGGSITGYRIWYRESNTTTATSVDLSSNSVAGHYDLIVPSYTRGNSLIVSVVTIGTGELYSDAKRAATSPIINKLPVLTSVSLSDTSSITNQTLYGDSASINVYFSGSSNDSGQTVSYYYSTSASGGKIKISNGEKLTISSNNQTSTTVTYYFWAYDGFEYSSSYKTIKVTLISNLTLELNSGSPTHNTITALDGITKYLKSSLISIKTNRTSLAAFQGITIKLNGEELNSNYYSYNMDSTNLNFTLDFYKTNLILQEGNNTLQFNITPKDGTTPSPVKVIFNTNDTGIIFTSLGEFNLNNYSTGDKGEKICYNTIELDHNRIKALESKASAISLYRGIKTANSNSFSYTPLSYTTSKDNVTNLLEGTAIKYRAVVTNPYGISSTFEQESEIQKLYKPIITNFSHSNWLEPYRPLSFTDDGTELAIVIHNSEIKINNKLVSDGNASYPEEWNFNLVNSSGENVGGNIEVTGDTSNSGEVVFRIPNKTIIDLINNNYSGSKIGTTTMGFSISCIDEYDLESNKLTKSNILLIDFNETPSFGGKTFTLEHLMFTDKVNENYEGIEDKTFVDVKNNLNYQKVNPYEWIRITAPDVTDLNQQAGAESFDKFTYKLYRRLITEATGDDILLETRTGKGIFYFKSDSYYSEIVKYKYKIEVYDTQGLKDTCYSGLDNYDLIFFPTNPLSNFTELINFKDGIVDLTLEDNLCGYSPYSSYLNLWRGEYNKDFKVHLVKSINYTDLEILSKNPSGIATSSNDKTSAEVSQGSTVKLSLENNADATTYYLVILQISTGLKLDNSINYIYTTSPIYSVDPNAPTIAVRKGYLGINCKEIESNELIRIQAPSTGQRMEVVFVREGGNEVKVSINLTDGSINGAKIDGGTW